MISLGMAAWRVLKAAKRTHRSAAAGGFLAETEAMGAQVSGSAIRGSDGERTNNTITAERDGALYADEKPLATVKGFDGPGLIPAGWATQDTRRPLAGVASRPKSSGQHIIPSADFIPSPLTSFRDAVEPPTATLVGSTNVETIRGTLANNAPKRVLTNSFVRPGLIPAARASTSENGRRMLRGPVKPDVHPSEVPFCTSLRAADELLNRCTPTRDGFSRGGNPSESATHARGAVVRNRNR